MQVYRAPLDEMLFVLCDVLGSHTAAGETRETFAAILREAAKFAEQDLLPINQAIDREGAVLENGVVRVPAAIHQAYKTYVEGGWPLLSVAAEHGGQGLPMTLRVAVDEMMSSTCMVFTLFPGLTFSGHEMLALHGSEDLKAAYLPKLGSGEWLATMCLTEAQAGTDLGLIKTRAIANADGSYALSGSKIFITNADHDLSPNIVHFVLARLPEAPGGSKGISLFLCPKILPDGKRNSLSVSALEDKMGLRASPTCVLNFDGAKAWLMGEPHKGLACMFTMMNSARLFVGVQGLGIAEAAVQSATAYADSRLQSRYVGGSRYPNQAADPISVHPNVARKLTMLKVLTAGARGLALWMAHELDRSQRESDLEKKQEAADLASLFTPIVKAMLTDLGSQAADEAIQMFGGHGYIKGNGMEQFARDVRITRIYEGTNDIQAIDLMTRKLALHGGRLPDRFFAVVNGFRETHGKEALSPAFTEAYAALHDLTLNGVGVVNGNPALAVAIAADYLRLFGLVAIGFIWCRMAQKDEARRQAADFYMKNVLVEWKMLHARMVALCDEAQP